MSRLKWKVCKKISKTIDELSNSNMNQAQWLWTYYNVLEDEKEEIERENNFIESIYCCLNPKGYNQYIKNKRDKVVSKVKIDEQITADKFKDIMKDISRYTIPVYEDKTKKKNTDLTEIF